MNYERLEVFIEFLAFGVIAGIVEDLIAIHLATDAPFSWRIVGIVILVAIPFAVLGELFVDRIDWLPNNKSRKRKLLRATSRR